MDASSEDDLTNQYLDRLEQLLDKRNTDTGDVRSRLSRLEGQVAEIRKAQKEMSGQLEVVATVLTAGKGAFQVLEFIGKVAKPFLWIGGLVAILAALMAKYRIG